LEAKNLSGSNDLVPLEEEENALPATNDLVSLQEEENALLGHQ
jgi:hypothetical protein